MNVHKALEYLENLDVSSENDISDDESFISKGRLVILPPNDKGDRDTDEDSGDKNELLSNNLDKIQLLAGGTVNFSTSSGNILLGTGDKEEVAGPSVDVLSKMNKESCIFQGKCIFVSLTSCWHDVKQHCSYFLAWPLALSLS